MSEWETPTARHAGFAYDRLRAVGREQNQPETCWAACLAMGSALLGKPDWNNEIAWFRRAKTAGLLQPGTARVHPNNLRDVVTSVRGFAFTAYELANAIDAMWNALVADRVILFANVEHVVVLGQMQQDKANGAVVFHVVDPARGSPSSWVAADIGAFGPDFWGVMSTT